MRGRPTETGQARPAMRERRGKATGARENCGSAKNLLRLAGRSWLGDRPAGDVAGAIRCGAAKHFSGFERPPDFRGPTCFNIRPPQNARQTLNQTYSSTNSLRNPRARVHPEAVEIRPQAVAREPIDDPVDTG
jgi:hypothetical protein